MYIYIYIYMYKLLMPCYLNMSENITENIIKRRDIENFVIFRFFRFFTNLLRTDGETETVKTIYT